MTQFTDYVYDLEAYPNFFSMVIVNTVSHELYAFEVSDRVNHSEAMMSYLRSLMYAVTPAHDVRMVGYNNVGFDYPILHDGITRGYFHYEHAYAKAMDIIKGADPVKDNLFKNMIWPSDRFIPQLDLFKIHHFDNRARATSLKVLEFNMRSKNIEDLPFEPGTILTPEQMDVVLEYNKHDVMETWRFLNKSQDMIRFREELTEKYNRDFMNHNDTKIGKDYFIMKLEEAGVECFTYRPKKPIQTRRQYINLKDAVLSSIEFKEPEFNRILNWFKFQRITETKGVFENVSCTVNGFEFDFGLGGIHGSVESQIVSADRGWIIIDLDVASYYPNLAIANRFYPEHLSEKFCDIYQDVYEQRRKFKKGTAENAMLKLALNGVYGDSNNQYSPFYDPLYTMKITINGQLLLCKLAEMLMEIPDLQMIQVNTDGLTVRVPRHAQHTVGLVAKEWEQMTGLELEDAYYSRMFIRDVNNYIAEYDDGKLKRKGAYCYGDDLGWHQNHGAQIIARAAEAYLVHGVPVRKTIELHSEVWDFFLNTKVPRSSKLLLVDDDGNEELLSNITRYYVSKQGGHLVKLMPPLAKKPDEWRRIGIDVGWKVCPCNDVSTVDLVDAPIDYEYYVSEAYKLVNGLLPSL